MSSALFSSNNDQAIESLQSLVDFHEGTWVGTSVRSFSVTDDVAAGIVGRQTLPANAYKVHVKFGVDLQRKDYELTETMEYGENFGNLSVRKALLANSNMDVDAVDGSYSLDMTLPDFPAAIAGTDKFLQFVIEHCIATSDDTRTRCFAFYGGADEQLVRVVLCEENRVEKEAAKKEESVKDNKVQLTAQDLLEMQSDVDQLVDKITGRLDSSSNKSGNSKEDDDVSESTRLERLQSAMVGQAKDVSEESSGNSLFKHQASLLEVSSGVWLGDAIVRDMPMVPTSPAEAQQLGPSGKGFGSGSSGQAVTINPKFADWTVGVQKVAWRIMWNFGEEIRQINDVGKAMGASMAQALARSLAGSVCVNESLSRRMPKEDRMVYIDYEGGNVGFLVGSTSIQLPRYLKFDRTRQLRPFYTEFSVFQAADSSNGSDNAEITDGTPEPKLPQIVCSKMSRVYNYEGRLKQGVTSFFTLKRFGIDIDE